MKRETVLAIASILLMSILPARLAAQQLNQDLKSGKKQVKKIVIVPPEASLVKYAMKGAEPLVDESRAMEAGLSSVVAQSLSQKGFSILPDAFSADALDRNSDLKYALSDMQTRYDKLEVLVAKKPKGVRTGRFSLGDEVANLCPGEEADALVFVRANGYLPTAGLKTFVIVTGMGVSRSFAKLTISVVDAQTGTILYFAEPNVYGNFVGDPDSMKVRIYNSFSYFWLQYQVKK